MSTPKSTTGATPRPLVFDMRCFGCGAPGLVYVSDDIKGLCAELRTLEGWRLWAPELPLCTVVIRCPSCIDSKNIYAP